MALTNLTNLQPVHVHSIGIGTFDGSVSIGGTLTYEDVTNIDSIGIVTARDDINIITDGKKLNIGASADLQLHHTSNHSYIDDAGAGNLRLRSGTLEIQNLASSKTSAVFSSGGGQTLNFNDSTKFVTTNTGVVITGICTATSFNGDGSNLTGITQTTINNNANNRLITGSGTANTLEGEANLTYNGSILHNQISAGARNDFSTSADGLIIEKGGNTGLSIDPGSSGVANIYFPNESNHSIASISHNNSNGELRVRGEDHIILSTNNNTERLRITSDGDIYGPSGGRKNWFDNGSFDCRGGRRGNTSMDYGNYHAYGWVTDRWMSRDATQWTRSTNVPAGKGFSFSTSANGGGVMMQAVELPDYGDMGVFAPSSYWCISYWGTVGANLGAAGFHYDLSGGYTGITQVASGSFLSSGETASGSSSGTFTRYYKNVQMPSSINSTAIAAYFTIGLLGSGYATGFQLERIPYSTAKPSPYEHVDPLTTITRCRRYCFQNVNSRLFGGYKRHDNNIHWSEQHPVPPTHMPSGSNQSNNPYGIILHDAGLLTNFQSILQNPGVNSVSISEFDYRSGRFIIVGTTNWSSTHTFVPSWESQEYEIGHGFF